MSEVEMSQREKMRCLMNGLVDQGLTEYGSVIPMSLVHEYLGITVPDVATREEFNRISLLELAAIDYCRNILLGEGKYLSGTASGYRILLPSENQAQIANYMTSADRKLSRALKLNRNMPKMDSFQPSQIEARILLKRDGMRRGVSSAEEALMV